MINPIYLGVNVDHIATLRQARGTPYPDPVEAALLAERAGADGITMHLREDRRHIQDDDIYRAQELLTTRLNLEMAASEEMLAIAEKLKPAYCCLVPENRKELTTEGGLDVAGNLVAIKAACGRLADAGIQVSLFIDADHAQIDAAVACGAPLIELHTGVYADCAGVAQKQALSTLTECAYYAHEAGLLVNAGHGLHYGNTEAIAKIGIINELNIGHSIVSQAAIIGLNAAVSEMKALMGEARNMLATCIDSQ